jgi:hypothetical protein
MVGQGRILRKIYRRAEAANADRNFWREIAVLGLSTRSSCRNWDLRVTI